MRKAKGARVYAALGATLIAMIMPNIAFADTSTSGANGISGGDVQSLSGDTPLSRLPKYDPQSGAEKGKTEILLCGPFEHLRMTALSRIYLDNVPNIQASWVTQGPKIGQLSLMVGCNDMGSLMMEENVVSAAGTTFDMKLQQLRDLITTCGYVPVQRNYYYEHL